MNIWTVPPSKVITAAAKADAVVVARLALVDAERDRRIAAGFLFGGKLYQARDMDIRNINGASTAAAIAIMNGSQPGDLRWSDPARDFGWIAADNSVVTMDAPTAIMFGQAAMSWVTGLTMAGRRIKDRLIAGDQVEITDDQQWQRTD